MGNSTIYKILKQGYPATYNFKDEADGTSGTDIAFVDLATLYDGVCEIVSDWQGHRKVLRLQDDATPGEDPQFYHNETQATAGTREFYIGTNDVTEVWHIRFYEVATILERLILAASKLYWYDGDLHEIQAVSNNTLYHIKFVWRADNTFDVYVDGIKKVDNENLENNQVSGLNRVLFLCMGDSEDYLYIDAWGDPDNDANYNVGDNIHWRNYKESTDSFEGDDVGTQGTSITWVDGVDTAASSELVQEFNEHKKIIRQAYTSGAGGFDYSEHNFASQSKTGWFATWIKVSDITVDGYIELVDSGEAPIISLGIGNSVFEYQANGGAWTTVPSSPTPVNDTWYHIYIQWYDAANDNFDLWIDNVQYLDGVQTLANMGVGIDKVQVRGFSATEYIYVDAPTSSLDSDLRADNRIFEYHSLSKTDITSKCSECYITKSITTYATAYIEISETLGNEHYLQIIDENSDLRFIGNRFKDIDIGISINSYSFQDLNKVDLETESIYSASSAEDVNASLLGVFTNVGQEDGRLIYYTEDDPAGNLTPNYRNKPNHMVIRILAIRGGKKAIIKASGKIFIDDDANPDNGAATITETSSELMGIPMIDRASHQINYVEVRGGIDPDTGTPFSGVSQDASAQADGTGLIPYYKRLRELQSDIDCQNVAKAIREGTNFAPQIPRVRLRGIYADPGEVINFANANKSFSATNCYVDGVRMNVLNNICFYSLNTGIFDPITLNAPGYTMADETADDVVGSLYERTNTKSIPFYPVTVTGAAWEARGVQLNSADEFLNTYLYIGNKVATNQDVIITFVWERNDDNNDTITGELSIARFEVSGTGSATIENATEITLEASLQNDFGKYVYTLVASDVVESYVYEIGFGIKENRDIVVSLIEVRHHFKK